MRHTFLLSLAVAAYAASGIGFTGAENISPVANGNSWNRRLRLSADVDEERDAAGIAATFISTTKEGAIAKNAAKMADAVKNAARLSDDEMAKLTKLIASDKAKEAVKLSDDEVAKMSVLLKKANIDDVGLADNELAKLANTFAKAQKSAGLSDDQVVKLTEMVVAAKKIQAISKVTDDEVAKVTDMFKKASAGVANGAKFTDDEVVKLSKALAAAQKGAGLSDDQVAKLKKTFTEAKQAGTVSDEQAAKISTELAEVAKKDKKSWSTLKKVIVTTLGVTGGAAIVYGAYKMGANSALDFYLGHRWAWFCLGPQDLNQDLLENWPYVRTDPLFGSSYNRTHNATSLAH